MYKSEVHSSGDKTRSPSIDDNTRCFDFLKNCCKESKKKDMSSQIEDKEVSSSNSDSRNASSLNDVPIPSPRSTETREKSAQQKRLDLGKFIIEHFTKEGRELRKRKNSKK